MSSYNQTELELGAAAEEQNEIIVAGDDAEIIDDVEGDGGRPEDCVCGKFNGHVDLPCFTCHMAGFESVADD